MIKKNEIDKDQRRFHQNIEDRRWNASRRLALVVKNAKKTFQMLDHPSNVELRKKVFMIKTAVAALVMLIDFAISCRFWSFPSFCTQAVMFEDQIRSISTSGDDSLCWFTCDARQFQDHAQTARQMYGILRKDLLHAADAHQCASRQAEVRQRNRLSADAIRCFDRIASSFRAYMMDLLKLTALTSIHDGIKASAKVVKQVENLLLSSLIYRRARARASFRLGLFNYQTFRNFRICRRCIIRAPKRQSKVPCRPAHAQRGQINEAHQ